MSQMDLGYAGHVIQLPIARGSRADVLEMQKRHVTLATADYCNTCMAPGHVIWIWAYLTSTPTFLGSVDGVRPCLGHCLSFAASMIDFASRWTRCHRSNFDSSA